MRLISPVITMDVEIERGHVENRSLVLSGFAGINEVEARVSGVEAWRLLRILCRASILWFLLKALFKGGEP